MRVVWSASRGEFSIGDYYYFSKLTRVAEKEGIEMTEEKRFTNLGEYDLIVFNYPEIKFTKSDVLRIRKWVENGKKIILAGYYSNVDKVSQNVNRVARYFGLRVNYDLIKDPEKNLGDEMFPIARCGNLEVVMPCSASVVGGKEFVVGKSIFGAVSNNVLVLGTCVFWDNYALSLAQNKDFALKILRGDF
ncbi:MAG: DUF4350 domain-containing protein [Archaeoglobaceae archaeon]|nr:DUF4350 domain-containing protein [Archaeoglobaceae archaeon]MDW8117882.1 DUF4350 domain-containing protein [Archaeoglobaceae archaeon]